MPAEVAAAIILAVPALIAGVPGLVVMRRTKTNHGKKLGTHVEDLVDHATNMEAWAVLHQESDNELRVALGLDRVDLPFPSRHA